MNGREEAIRDRYKPYKANVAPINPGQDDWRSYHFRNQAIQNANEVRERRATLENPQWAMSRDADWYQDRGNLASIKGTLAGMPTVTTDQDEGRNMYQMLMNQMVGGGGARLIDTRGLPDQAYRTGSRIYQDPSKSQGFFGDLGSMISGRPNPAAVHVNEWNPFPNFGQEGRDWYVGEFGQPWGEKLEGLMKLALPGPLKWMKEREREPLPSDRSWVPENVGSYKKIPEIPFVEDIMETIEEDDLTDMIEEDDIDERILRGPFPPGIAYPGYNEDITISDLPFVLKEAKFPQGNLGWIDPVTMEENYDYNPIWDLNIMNIQDYELKKKATDAAIQFNNLWKSKKGKEDKSDMYELEKLYEEYMDAVEAGAQ